VIDDPYLIPGTQTLRNLPGFVDPDRLAKFEADATRARLVELEAHPVHGRWDLRHLQAIHRHIFQDVYPWAGRLRTVDISKGGHLFARPQFLVTSAGHVFRRLVDQGFLLGLDRERFVTAAAELLGDVNALHPFREGNGRAQRAYLSALARAAGWRIAWERMDPDENIAASISSHDGDNRPFRALLAKLTHAANETHLPPSPSREEATDPPHETRGPTQRQPHIAESRDTSEDARRAAEAERQRLVEEDCVRRQQEHDHGLRMGINH
jgi:cell filamentation protein